MLRFGLCANEAIPRKHARVRLLLASTGYELSHLVRRTGSNVRNLQRAMMSQLFAAAPAAATHTHDNSLTSD